MTEIILTNMIDPLEKTYTKGIFNTKKIKNNYRKHVRFGRQGQMGKQTHNRYFYERQDKWEKLK